MVLQKSLLYHIRESWKKWQLLEHYISRRYSLPKSSSCAKVYRAAGENTIQKKLRSRYTSENMIILLGKSQFVIPGLLSKNSKELVALASICGMKSKEELEWEELAYQAVTPYALLDGNEMSSRILIPAAMLA